MVELFLIVVTLVVACAAWQFIPAFRWVVKATLVVAVVGAVGIYAWLAKEEQDAKRAQETAQAQQLPPCDWHQLPSGNRFTLDTKPCR